MIVFFSIQHSVGWFRWIKSRLGLADFVLPPSSVRSLYLAIDSDKPHASGFRQLALPFLRAAPTKTTRNSKTAWSVGYRHLHYNAFHMFALEDGAGDGYRFVKS